jgi:hypothetical protein
MISKKQTFVRIYRVGDVLAGMQEAFDLMPSHNYQTFVSHDASELQAKAWERTGAQMRKAIRFIDGRLSENDRRKIANNAS